MDANILTAAELRSALGEPGTGEVHNHPRARTLIEAQKLHRREAMQAVLDTADARGDENLRASEDRDFRKHESVLDLLKVYEAELDDSPQQRAANAARRAGLSGAFVTREHGTYGPEGEHSYFRDQAQFRCFGDVEALTRLQRHAQETDNRIAHDDYPGAKEQRDLSRTDGAGGYFVPPAWLMSDYIALARAGRPTANVITNLALPPGTDSLNIPKVATGTATAIQTADNQSVQDTDITDTSIAAGVKTVAGQQDVAIQVLEQSPVAFDQIIFADLIADYATKVDLQVLNGANSGGEVKGILGATGINTVTYTDTTPTLPEIWPKVADAINKIHTNRFLSPTVIVMHPRRWTWMLAALDNNNRPFIVPSSGEGPTNSMATVAGVNAEGIVGTLQGLPVVVDSNIPTTLGSGTNEDVILVMRASDVFLWESTIRTRVLPEVGSGTLTTRLQAYGYIAHTAERYPKGITTITGSGLVTPTL